MPLDSSWSRPPAGKEASHWTQPTHDRRIQLRGITAAQGTRRWTSSQSRSLGVQHVDRPADIKALPQPTRAGRPCVEAKAVRDVPCAKDVHRIGGHRARRRNVRDGPAVRPPESERAVGLSIDLIAILVNRAMVPAT